MIAASFFYVCLCMRLIHFRSYHGFIIFDSSAHFSVFICRWLWWWLWWYSRCCCHWRRYNISCIFQFILCRINSKFMCVPLPVSEPVSISLSVFVCVVCFQTFMHFFQSASAFSTTDTECCLARAVKGKRSTTSYNKRFVRRGSTTELQQN